MALRSLTESYVIKRGPLEDKELEDSSMRLQSSMRGFKSRRLAGNSELQHEVGIGFKKN